MSYGYIVACDKPSSFLETSRRYKFYNICSDATGYYYLRLEEGQDLTVRQGTSSILTEKGAAFFGSIESIRYFMDFLLTNCQGDADALMKMRNAINGASCDQIDKLAFIQGVRLEINKVYRVIL